MNIPTSAANDLVSILRDIATSAREAIRPKRVQLIEHAPAEGDGGTFIPVNNNQMTRLATMRWSDGRPHRATVFLQTQGITTDVGGVLGISGRITCGGMGRGVVKVFSGFPAIVPVEGNPITVEAMCSTLPVTYTLSPTGGAPPGGPSNSPSSAATVQCAAIVSEGWTDLPVPTQLASFQAPATAGNQPAPIVTGPVFIQSVTIKNTNTAAVQLVIGDRNSTALLAGRFNPQSSVIVPASSSIGLGVDALGPFFRGLCIAAVANIAGAPPTYGGYDANGANVMIDVWGQYVLG